MVQGMINNNGMSNLYNGYALVTSGYGSTITLQNLVVGKKYLMTVNCASSSQDNANNAVKVNSVTNGTFEQLKAPGGQYTGYYEANSAYILTPTDTTMQVNKQTNTLYMVFELA